MKVGLIHLLRGLALHDGDQPNVVIRPKAKERLILKEQVCLPPLLITEKVVDDEKHVSKIKRTPEGGLFYLRSTWHKASGIYNNISRNQEVQTLFDNRGLYDLFKQ